MPSSGSPVDVTGLQQAVHALQAPPLPRVYGAYSKDNDAVAHMRGKLNDTLKAPTRGDIVSTGILGVDIGLGGGLNFGSFHEVFGFSKGGKTYIIQRVGAMVHAKYDNALAFFFDRENAYDHASLAAQGLDPARTIIIPPAAIPTPVDLWNKIVDIMGMLGAGAPVDEISDAAKVADPTVGMEEDDPKTGKKGGKKAKSFGNSRKVTKATPHLYMGIDSVPAFAEQEDMITDQGRRAKEWHAFFRRFTGILDSKLMLTASNHIIYKPGIYGNPESKTSGLALDYYRDCGIKCMKLHPMYGQGETEIGNMLGIEVEKSRRGGVGVNTFFPVYNNGGVHYFSGILRVAEYFGLVTQTNMSAFKDKKAWGRVWAKYEYTGGPKRVVLSEENPEELAELIQSSGLYSAIVEFAQKNLAYSA